MCFASILGWVPKRDLFLHDDIRHRLFPLGHRLGPAPSLLRRCHPRNLVIAGTLLTAPWCRGGSAAIGTAGHHGRGTSPLVLPLYGRHSAPLTSDTGLLPAGETAADHFTAWLHIYKIKNE
ncbi:hypothetical protein FKM82_000535 [Ascaphus truei]